MMDDASSNDLSTNKTIQMVSIKDRKSFLVSITATNPLKD